ncbi:hypothetical protein M438DRAFT_360616, partial [Aureobasidium pullulans EXF-150]
PKKTLKKMKVSKVSMSDLEDSNINPLLSIRVLKKRVPRPDATRSSRRATRGKTVPISRELTRKKTVSTSKQLLKVLPKKQAPKKQVPKKNVAKSSKGNMLGDKALRFVLLTNTKKGGTNALSKIKHY